MVLIKANSIFIHIAVQEFSRFHAKADDLHAPSVAPFVASRCLLLSTTFSPIPHREREQFTDTCACFVGHAYDDLVSSAHVCPLKTSDESEVQSRVINGFWNPLFVYQAKVVVRGSFPLRFFDATFWRHLGTRATHIGFFLVHLFK